jgi:hypothetical protein
MTVAKAAARLRKRVRVIVSSVTRERHKVLL